MVGDSSTSVFGGKTKRAIGARRDAVARSNEFDEQRARELLREQHIAPDLLSEMKGLERRLAKAGDHELAVDIRRKREPADKALAIAALAGTTLTSKQMLELAKRLGDYKQFGTARRLLRLASKDVKRTADPKIYSQIFQRSALYTYKDPDLPAEWRLVRALEILGTVEDLNVTTDAETLGLAGAIHKRLWEVRGQRTHLDRSLFFYLKGYAQGGPEACRGDVLDFLRRTPGCVMVAKDQGYCAINAAFLLDVIAQMEDQQSTQAGLVSHSGAQRREDARLIREEIVR